MCDFLFDNVLDSGRLLKNTGCELLMQQLKAMITKRLLNCRRKIGLGVFQLSMPILFSIFAAVAVNSTKEQTVVDISNVEQVIAAVERFHLGGLLFQNVFAFGYAFLVSTFVLFVVQERSGYVYQSQGIYFAEHNPKG